MFLNNKIGKLVDEYYHNDKLIDHDFVWDVFNLCNETWRLDGLIEDLEILDGRALTSYNYLTRELIIYFSRQVKENVLFFDDKEQILAHNLRELEKLLKQLIHIRQYKKVNHIFSVQSKLLYYGLEYDIITYNLANDHNYFLNNHHDLAIYLECIKKCLKLTEKNPSFRMARIDSLDRILEICKRLDFKDKKVVLDYYKSRLLIEQIQDYEDKAPSVKFLEYRDSVLAEKYGEEKLLLDSILSTTKNYCLKHRLYLGMDITKREKQKISDKLMKSDSIRLILEK